MYANHNNRQEALLARKRKRNSSIPIFTQQRQRSKQSSPHVPSHMFRSLRGSSQDWTERQEHDATSDETDSIKIQLKGLFIRTLTSVLNRTVKILQGSEERKKRKVDESKENPFNTKTKPETKKSNEVVPKTKKLSKKDLLQAEFQPQLQANKKEVNFVKKPIDWNLEQLVKKDKEEQLENKNYGTKFYKKNKYSSPNVESKYLKAIYEGQFKSPSPKDTTPPSTSSASYFKKSIDGIHSLTETIKKNWDTDSSDDVVILKEVKLPPISTPSKFPLKFDLTDLSFNTDFAYYQNLLNQKKLESEKISKKISEAKKPKSQLIKKLTSEEESEVINIWKSKGRDHQLIVDALNVEVKVQDFKTLADKRWLNDVVIEIFLKSLQTDKIYAFNSFMFTTMQSKGYQGVQKWMKRAKVQINKLDLILCPINVGQTHWVLGAIDLKNKKISYYDSLATSVNNFSLKALDLLEEFVKGETKKQGVPELGQGFTKEHVLDCPQQQNGYDCGVMTLLNSYYLSKNSALTYHPSEAKDFRRIIAHTILKLAK